MLKRFISAFVAALLVMTAALPSALAAGENDTAAAVEFLAKAHIIDEGFSLGGNMNRGEFALIAARLFGGADSFADLGCFADVGGDGELAAAVNMLASYGIVKGDENNMFNPIEKLTYEAALTMIARILGYETAAEANGGYIGGYVSFAARSGITKGIRGDEPLNTKAVILLYNAMDAPMMVQNSYGGSLELRIDKDSTVLGTLMNLDKITARLYAVGGAALSDEYAVPEGVIGTGSRTFSYDGEDLSDMLGMTADIYYKKDSPTKAEFAVATGDDDVLEISLDDLEDTDLANGRLTYYDGGKKRNADIERMPYTVYNGRAVDVLPALGSEGTVRCIGKSKKYDAVIVEDYDTHFVTGVYDDGNKLKSKYGKKTLPDFTDFDAVAVYVGGKAATLSDINENTAVSAAISTDGTYAKLLVSEGRFYGKIDATQGADENDFTLRISGEEYKTTRAVYEYFSAKAPSAVIGTVTYFYADVFGRIAGFDDGGERRCEVGYMRGIISASGLGEVKVRLLMPSGGFENIVISKNLKYDGSSRIDGISAAAWFEQNRNSAALITYRLNADGELSEVNSVGSDEGLHEIAYVSANKRYRTATRSFGAKAIAAADARVIVLPKNDAAKNDEDCFLYTDLSKFASNNEYADLYFYSFDEDSLVADVILYNRSFNPYLQDVCPIVIGGITKSVGNDGMSASRIGAYSGGNEVAYIGKSGVDFNYTDKYFPNKSGAKTKVGAGDLVRVYQDFAGNITGTELIYSYEKDEYYPTANPYAKTDTEAYRFGMGVADAHDGNIIRVRYRGTDEVDYFDISSTTVVLIEKSRDGVTISHGTAGDVACCENCNVFVYSPSNAATIIYLYVK